MKFNTRWLRMELVLHKSEQGVSYIHLNRPESFNALNKDMLQKLLEVIQAVEKNDDKFVVLTGEGKAFCAGGDISMMQDFREGDFFEDVMDVIEDIVLRLYRMPKIIISAINGSAAGLGLSLALTADYVVAHKEAKLGMLFLGVGLVPDGGGHFWLEQRMGTHQAKQFIWSMKQVQGNDAQTLGLADILTEDDALIHTKQLLKKLIHTPIQSMLHIKKVYRSKNEDVLIEYLAKEREAQWELGKTYDHQEGVSAFLAKRKPLFKGE